MRHPDDKMTGWQDGEQHLVILSYYPWPRPLLGMRALATIHASGDGVRD